VSDEELIITWLRADTYTWRGKPSELPECFRPDPSLTDWDDITQCVYDRLSSPEDEGISVDAAIRGWVEFEKNSEIEDNGDVSIEEVV